MKDTLSIESLDNFANNVQNTINNSLKTIKEIKEKYDNGDLIGSLANIHELLSKDTSSEIIRLILFNDSPETLLSKIELEISDSEKEFLTKIGFTLKEMLTDEMLILKYAEFYEDLINKEFGWSKFKAKLIPNSLLSFSFYLENSYFEESILFISSIPLKIEASDNFNDFFNNIDGFETLTDKIDSFNLHKENQTFSYEETLGAISSELSNALDYSKKLNIEESINSTPIDLIKTFSLSDLKLMKDKFLKLSKQLEQEESDQNSKKFSFRKFVDPEMAVSANDKIQLSKVYDKLHNLIMILIENFNVNKYDKTIYNITLLGYTEEVYDKKNQKEVSFDDFILNGSEKLINSISSISKKFKNSK